MDGLLVVDKPVGPTSHDVVARLRRALREKRIGHTGTLDPMASGVLALVVGRATRLAQFMGADEKSYDARIQLGQATDTYDAEGMPTGPKYAGPWPSLDAIEAVLQPLHGTFLQQPPAYSAKKIAGQRSYALARARARTLATTTAVEIAVEPTEAVDAARLPDPVPVTLLACDLTGYTDGVISLSLTSSAGFYVRSLAHDIGQRLGTGAHLAGLRRTRSGTVTLADARPLEALEADPARATEALVPMARMLPHLPSAHLTDRGTERARHGALLTRGDWREVESDDRTASAEKADAMCRLIASDGSLVGIARPSGPRAGEPETLQPTVILA